MSIATVLLFHDGKEGWHVEINGLVYSQRQSFKKQFQNSLEKNPNGATISISPSEDPSLKGHQSEPPLHIVVPFLKNLAQLGYQVAASDSTGDENGYRKTTLWTLTSLN